MKRGIRLILAGDIGGTHTRLALFQKEKLVFEEIFSSRDYEALLPIVKEYLGGKGRVESACFGVAGAVRNGVCKATNLPWIIDARELKSSLQIAGEVSLLNDLESSAYGVLELEKKDLYSLNTPPNSQEGNRVLVSAGTGLGEAGIIWNGKEHFPFASEGGHVDFAPRSLLEMELLEFLEKQFGHVSYERVISGSGLLQLYRFLVEKGAVESFDVQREMKEKDPAFVISEWGKSGKDPLSEKALNWFLSLYGAEAGNCALKILAFGGVYLGGGIAPQLLEKLKEGPFLEAFFDKGRFKSVLESIPVFVVLNPATALLGAAAYAQKHSKAAKRNFS